ncbi:hypothetical protein GOODEAATRI_008957 [Goodea atripinnis]|uniref:Uncharacterized protein n=1 Tax=Goodea atripinnis TaxID=208336 RepID=A0ABV0MR33_9TELE
MEATRVDVLRCASDRWCRHALPNAWRVIGLKSVRTIRDRGDHIFFGVADIPPHAHMTPRSSQLMIHKRMERVSVEACNRPLACNDNYNNGLIVGLWHQSGFSAHLHNCS